MPLPKRTFVTQGFAVAAPACIPRKLPGADRVPKGVLETEVVANLDGASSVADIARRVRISDVECAAVVARLVDLGCATFAEEDVTDREARATLPTVNVVSGRRRSGRRRKLV